VLQVRIHGRGGQGVVTAAELLSLAAFDEGLHAQAFPTFGSERMFADAVAGELDPARLLFLDLDHCKRCGICAEECPCGAIAMEPETI
jgi:ferredoxin